jgi:hypothetical protein
MTPISERVMVVLPTPDGPVSASTYYINAYRDESGNNTTFNRNDSNEFSNGINNKV